MKKTLLFIVTIFFCVVIGATGAEIKSVTLLTNVLDQYQKVEWDIVLSAQWEDPFLFTDIALDMVIVSPSGKRQTLPCYYVSGESGQESVWKARYMPAEPGSFQYSVVLKQKGKSPIQTEPGHFSVNTSSAKGVLHTYDQWTFRYDNGELFRGIGENICWESRDNDDSRYFKALHEEPRFNYEFMLRKLADNDGNFFRTWMIYWNLPVDWKTVNNNSRYRNTTSMYNESASTRMDRLTSLCDSLGLHMMLALESHVGYMGLGWDISSYNKKNGGTATIPVEFFTLESAKTQYKCKLRYMVARWGYSPSIGAWEFFNEIDNVMYNGEPKDRISDAVITAWHDEMSRFLAETDPFDHIITTSISHRDVEGLNSLPHIDVNQRHIYKHTQDIPRVIRENVQKFNKPYIIGEFGYEWDWSKNFNDFGDEMDGDFKRGLWYGLFSPTPVLPMSWWWEFFENRGLMAYFDRVSEIHENMMQSGKGDYQEIKVESEESGLVSYGVRCGDQSYFYLFNPLDDEKKITLNTSLNLNGQYMIQYYDCETGVYCSLNRVESKEGRFVVQDFKMQPGTDGVLILRVMQK